VNRGALLVNLTRTLIALGDAARAYALATEHTASVRGRVLRAELGYNRAVAAYNLGRFRIALGLLQAYAADHPRDAVCVFLVGAAAAEVGEVDVAKGALRRYLALRHPDPARNLEARRILAGL
jgi:predicted Zn-dependent protease